MVPPRAVDGLALQDLPSRDTSLTAAEGCMVVGL